MFLTSRQKVMRELLNKKAEIVLQPKDLETWNSKKHIADFSFYLILLNIPLDLYILFRLRGKEAQRMRTISNLYALAVFPAFIYASHLHRENLKDVTKRYLTHINDDELEKEMNIAKGSIFWWKNKDQ